MISKFIREQKRYTQRELYSILECREEKAIPIIKRLKEYGVLKTVKATDTQMDMSDLIEEDIEVADIEADQNEYLFVFTFVGVITIAGRVLKCYPKYLLSASEPKNELKQIIKVLEKYNSNEQIIRMYNDSSESKSFNLLAVLLYLLYDYYDNGTYTNTEVIIESNGFGEILWDITINETFTLLCNNIPYYPDLKTKKRVNDDIDYFKRLHECILTRASKELADADLMDLFDIFSVELSDESLDDFGDKEYILDRIEKEFNVQFGTRKHLLLKTLYAYVSHSSGLYDIDCFSMFGTKNFNQVWEKVCADVFDNRLHTPLSELRLPIPLKQCYSRNDPLISLIEKPKWNGMEAKETLMPDLISIIEKDGQFQFIIFDAKYYNAQIEPGKMLRAQPGIESVIKQYMYQLAYKRFIEEHEFSAIFNCFLMPTESNNVVSRGCVSLAMLDKLGLQQIKVRFIPAIVLYEHYLCGTKYDISHLKLQEA